MKVCLAIVLFLIPVFLFSKTPVDSLKIENLKKTYIVSDTVSFVFRNESHEKLYILISLEKKSNGKWKLFMPDIYQKDDIFMVDYVLCLKSMEYMKENWVVKDFMFKGPKNSKFRFVYNIGLKPNKLIVRKFSNNFRMCL